MQDLKNLLSGLPNKQRQARPNVYNPGAENQQFPGMEIFPGASIEQIKQFIRKQKRAKGYAYNLPANSSEEVNFQISGTAQLLLGFTIIPTGVGLDPNIPSNYPEAVTLKINDEIVLEKIHGYQLSPVNLKDEYYFFPRPLSGQDSTSWIFENTTARTIAVMLYYI